VSKVVRPYDSRGSSRVIAAAVLFLLWLFVFAVRAKNEQ
jgi:hypothetical protein